MDDKKIGFNYLNIIIPISIILLIVFYYLYSNNNNTKINIIVTDKPIITKPPKNNKLIVELVSNDKKEVHTTRKPLSPSELRIIEDQKNIKLAFEFFNKYNNKLVIFNTETDQNIGLVDANVKDKYNIYFSSNRAIEDDCPNYISSNSNLDTIDQKYIDALLALGYNNIKDGSKTYIFNKDYVKQFNDYCSRNKQLPECKLDINNYKINSDTDNYTKLCNDLTTDSNLYNKLCNTMFINNKTSYENTCIDCKNQKYPRSGDLYQLYNQKCKNIVEEDLLEKYDNKWFINSNATPAFSYSNKIYNMNRRETDLGETIINQDVCPKLTKDGLKIDETDNKISFNKNISEIINNPLIQKYDSTIKDKLDKLTDTTYKVKNTNYGNNQKPFLVPQLGVSDSLFNDDKDKYFSLCADCSKKELVPDVPEVVDYCKKEVLRKNNYENKWINNLFLNSECTSHVSSNYIPAYVKDDTIYNINTNDEVVDTKVCPKINEILEVNYPEPLSPYRRRQLSCNQVKNLSSYGVQNVNNFKGPHIYTINYSQKNIETYCIEFAYGIEKIDVDIHNPDTYLSDAEFCAKIEESLNSDSELTNKPSSELPNKPIQGEVVKFCQYYKGFWQFEDDLNNESRKNKYYGLKKIKTKYYWVEPKKSYFLSQIVDKKDILPTLQNAFEDLVKYYKSHFKSKNIIQVTSKPIGGSCKIKIDTLKQKPLINQANEDSLSLSFCTLDVDKDNCLYGYEGVIENENDINKCSCRCIKSCDSDSDCIPKKEKCTLPKEYPSSIDEKIIIRNNEKIHTKIPIISKNIDVKTCKFNNQNNIDLDSIYSSESNLKYQTCALIENKCEPNDYTPSNIYSSTCDCRCLKNCNNDDDCNTSNEKCLNNVCQCDKTKNFIRMGNTCRLINNIKNINNKKVCTCNEEKQYLRNNINDQCMLNPLTDVAYLQKLRQQKSLTMSGFISSDLLKIRDKYTINIIPSIHNSFNLKYPEKFIDICYSCNSDIPSFYNKKEEDIINEKCKSNS